MTDHSLTWFTIIDFMTIAEHCCYMIYAHAGELHLSPGRQAHSQNFKALSDVGACRNGGWTFRMPWSFAVECWRLNEFDCFNFIDFHCLFLTWIHHDTSIVYNFLTAGELTISWGFHFLGLMYGLTYIDIMRYICSLLVEDQQFEFDPQKMELSQVPYIRTPIVDGLFQNFFWDNDPRC